MKRTTARQRSAGRIRVSAAAEKHQLVQSPIGHANLKCMFCFEIAVVTCRFQLPKKVSRAIIMDPFLDPFKSL